jgi:hypothetical protein
MTTSVSEYVFSPWLTPVRVVSTANIAGTYYNGPNNNGVGATFTIAASSLTIDSVVVAVNDRVLLQTQTATYQQGIYVVESIGSTVVLKRSEDQQSLEQIQTGQYVSVKGGSVNAGSFFTVIEPRPQNIGVDAIVFSADPASGAAVTFSGPASTANSPAIFSGTSGNLKAQTATATFGFGITAATGNIAATTGNLTSGSAAGGNVGLVEAFPTTASSGYLGMQAAVNGSGNFGTLLSNQTVQAQNQVLTFPDVGAATGNVLAAGAALVSGNLVQASGTSGRVVDSGITAASVSAAVTQVGKLFQVSVTLTPTQMAAAYATPATIVANPLSSQLIVVHSATVYTASTGNTAYATGTAPIIQYGTGGTNGAHGAGTIATAAGLVAGDITAATSQVRTLLQSASAAVTGLSGNGIYFSNATGAYTGGTGTNVTITLVYELLTATV